MPGGPYSIELQHLQKLPMLHKSKIYFFFIIFLFSPRSDQMLEDIIFKLVPGLQESEPVFLITYVCFCTFSQLS